MILLTSDWHIDSRGRYGLSHSDPKIAKRELWFADFGAWLAQLCDGKGDFFDRNSTVARDVEAAGGFALILNAGDVWNRKTGLDVGLYCRTLTRLQELLTDRRPPMLIRTGNHDSYRGVEDSPLVPLAAALPRLHLLSSVSTQVYTDARTGVHVINFPTTASLSDERFDCGSSTRRLGMLHAPIGSGVLPNGMSVPDDESRSVPLIVLDDVAAHIGIDLFVCGDVHRPWLRSNGAALPVSDEWMALRDGADVLMIGAPYRLDFGDADQPRGVWIYDERRHRVAFVEYSNGPEFVTLDDASFNTYDFSAADPDYTVVRLRLVDAASVERYKNLVREGRFSCSVFPEFSHVPSTTVVPYPLSDTDLSPYELWDLYTDEYAADGDRSRLRTAGHALLTAASKVSE